MAAFVISSKYKVFLSGLPIIAGTVRIRTSGSADQKATTDGVFVGATQSKTTIDIHTPVFAASPLDVQSVAQKLVATTGVLSIVDLVNGSTRTAYVMINDEDESWDPEKSAEQDWSLVVAGEIIKT